MTAGEELVHRVSLQTARASLRGWSEPGQRSRDSSGGAAPLSGADYLSVPEEQIGTIESVLTVTGGDVVYSTPPFATFTPERLPPVCPAWSPVAVFGGYQRAGVE